LLRSLSLGRTRSRGDPCTSVMVTVPRNDAREANAMAQYGDGGIYVNFTGDGNADIVRKSYPPETYGRLQRVKDRYDPQNVFRFNQNVSPKS
jgi:FAD/FMN-containing dehydrogenase